MFSMPASPLQRLREALGRPPRAGSVSRADLVEVLKTAEMSERLRNYAAHTPDCRYHTEQHAYAGVMMPGACSCGLADVLEGRFPGEPPPDTIRARNERSKGTPRS